MARKLTMAPFTLDDVRAASQAIRGAVARTPSAHSETLSEILGATVILKFEIFQFTASFKERGARNRLLALTESEREAGVVGVSAGNHAQGVAHHARLLGIPATIVMPRGTPFVKVARTRHLGATVELSGDTIEEAFARGRELVEKGLTFIHPFDDPLVAAGQGTVALEMLEDHPDINMLVVPVGGGGLISGISVAARGISPSIEIVGVQSERYPSMEHAMAGNAGAVPGGPTIAEGIAVAEARGMTVDIVRQLVSGIEVVTEQSIEEAVNLLLEIEKVVVEGAGAAGIAAMLANRKRFAGRTVGVILSGGNIDPRLLASILERGLVRGGRLSRLRVEIDDRPGALAQLLDIVGRMGANILEVQHQRLFTEAPARLVDVDLSIETADPQHRDVVLEAVRDAGYTVIILPLEGTVA